jgi:ribosome-binding protein aMBF1 (putative translation factor)/uncharacterized DUF497 family protein
LDFDFVEWDSEDDPRGNAQHIADNGLSIDELEDVIYDPQSRPVQSRSSRRPALIGQTSTGKTIIRIYERHKHAGIVAIRHLSACEIEEGFMRSQTPMNPDGRQRRRLGAAELTPEQRAAVEARRADRQTPEYQEELARDIESYQQEYPPVRDPELTEALARLRREREQQGLSLTDMAERTGIDRATISKLETGKIVNPTIGTLRTYARALGRRLAWTLEADANQE